MVRQLIRWTTYGSACLFFLMMLGCAIYSTFYTPYRVIETSVYVSPPPRFDVHVQVEPDRVRTAVIETRKMTVTAYCACAECCDDGTDTLGITASGLTVEHNNGHFVAAPRNIPLNTMVRVPGYADFAQVPVIDRGGSISDHRLDVFFNNHQAALQWGVKELDVEIIWINKDHTQ